ncbi:acyl dehydratase [Marivirga tractuosa]|uniref:Enoyl-CoA hydratase n=1 Tax=Marivirga tractuosa (strain ATCC 23168 / DSM 4126 / NBRC 15989 / NCIMB 1408 / VKM B-1430 / H-43) TaxID=643867 RepID=E4TN42_MARTH|nr:MaoC family dehydratase [Marivirga tractuosa]ADR22456.1 Enoyl-CoA hydratase [Marivirga tractuosa DSM 4126]BDD16873.1 acyl dehydratase [Marivirga tractuosa]
MQPIEISSYEDFKAYEGQELGVSDWHTIDQNQVNQFADATLDHQWIHLDEERAAKSPFGGTIAHGYLTLSLAPYLWEQIAHVTNLKMMINYGIEKMKFNQAVKVGSAVRLKASLNSIVDLRGVSKAQIDIVMEIKDEKKHAYTASLIFLYHFNK